MKTNDYSDLYESLIRELASAGYKAIPSPLRIGEISIDLESVFEGPSDRLDLAVVLSAPNTTEDGYRKYWQVQRIARALDAVDSKRTITVLAIGGIDSTKLAAELQTIARVLHVDRSLPLRRLIAPMLRLDVPKLRSGAFDGMERVRNSAEDQQYSNDLRAIMGSARKGADAVASQYANWVDNSFTKARGSRSR